MSPRTKTLLAGLLFILIRPILADDAFIIQDGKPLAQIVIAKEPTRSQRLAASELQHYLRKISGAEVPIKQDSSQQKSVDLPITIYVGQSEATEKLGITSEGLQFGTYRIVSGENWLVLIGDDTNFTPIEPWPRGNSDNRSGRVQQAWNEITGHHWGYMHVQLYKHYSGSASTFGKPTEKATDKDGNVHVWNFDERGSFNAVCGFLRELGMRWYMPGEIGEIVPQLNSIALPKIDKTVQPDFPMRILNFRPGVYGRDVMMWGFRLGVRRPYGRQAAHGLSGMTDNPQTMKNHPDWFALYGGKRHIDPNQKNNQLCYSNEELFKEAVQFAKVQFDHFKMDVVSIMPPDGYTAICQCEHCQGKESPELGSRGHLSNYVWDFVNRVAKEVSKTHPNKKISCCAYGIYTEAPSNIQKLEPNVQVIIVGGRRPLAEDRAELRRLRAAWQSKTDSPIEIFENYPFTSRGFYLPAYIPKLLGESINETKGQSRGEDIWLSMDFSEKGVGFNHFLTYFTARMYWGGKTQSPDAIFDEYVTKFYGPAAPKMAKFFAYCEQHWREMSQEEKIAEHALALFSSAKEMVSAESIHGQRIQLIDQYLDRLRSKARQLAQKRGPVPTLRLVSGADRRGKITIDGKLDDPPWMKIPTASTGRLHELQTGRRPTFDTRVMVEWIGNDLYFGILCQDQSGEKLNVSTTKSNDQAIFYGDLVEIEIATDAHSYYQLAINPAGALIGLDRGASRTQQFNWSSQAEVATHVADDHWTVEIRIPVTQDANDPLHQVVGQKPIQSLPWFVNICRQRIREQGSEYSALSPTGTTGFHHPMKFAHLFAGSSHRFPADPIVTDYIIESRKAAALMKARKWDQAITAYQKLATREKISPFQKSYALQQAVKSANSLEKFDLAEEIASQIPEKAMAKTSHMQILSSQRKWEELIKQFGEEDFNQWPFGEIASAAFLRGNACYQRKQGKRAEADLKLALKYESDPRTQVSIRMIMAQNRQTHLKDDAGALKLYLENFSGKERISAADEFRSVQRAAAILRDQKEFSAALMIFEVVDFEKLTGTWLHEMLLSKAQTLKAAGEPETATKLYRQILDDANASKAHREEAQNQLNDQK